MKPLRTEDLNNILHTNSVTRESYLGTFPACVFPRTDKKMYSFISNTADHLDVKGEHWVGWYINKDQVYHFLIVMGEVHMMQHYPIISRHT